MDLKLGNECESNLDDKPDYTVDRKSIENEPEESEWPRKIRMEAID